MSLPLNPALGDLPVYQPGRPIEEVARELGLPPAEVIKLASNENPLGPSPKALEAMGRALAQLHLYPDGSAYYLKSRLAASTASRPMWRVPLAVSAPRVYAVEERLPEDVVPKLYVKIAHGEYLQMRLEPAGPG